MRYRKYLLFYIPAFLIICVLSACGLFLRPSGPYLEQLSLRQAGSYDWTDDLDYKGIKEAAEGSVRYFRKLPPDKKFQYGELTYSPEEMAASLELFVRTVRDHEGRERQKQLREKFRFFESVDSERGAFFTGYYEPLINGSHVPTDEFDEPLYETPDDLVEVDLGKFPLVPGSEKIVGRLEGRQLVPYYSREEIVNETSIKERARPIAYVNGIELFFLQIQGSGLVRFPDGSLKRVNYAKSNGHPYSAIGRVLTEHIPPDEMSLQAIKKYLYENPGEVNNILNYNKSYTFFREVEEGPLGCIEVPLTPDRSIAMDKRIIPSGGLAFIETELPVFEGGRMTGLKPVKRFVLVQDTGGAIRHHGRADIFFGHGENAELSAGHMKQRGRVFLIVARKEFLRSTEAMKSGRTEGE